MNKYEPVLLGMDFDISESSIQEAAKKCGPAFVYDLTLPTDFVLYFRTTVLIPCMLTIKDNPLSPWINVIADDSLGPYEWFLSANGKSFGSKGA